MGLCNIYGPRPATSGGNFLPPVPAPTLAGGVARDISVSGNRYHQQSGNDGQTTWE